MEKRHAEEQIVKILSEVEEVGSVREVTRKHIAGAKSMEVWSQALQEFPETEIT